MTKYFAILGLLCFTVLLSSAAYAGAPYEWQLGMQEAASTTMEKIHAFHDLVLYIIIAITIFVLLLLVYVVLRYNSHVNPEPSDTTHNVLLEIVWTVVPVVILIIIAIPSFQLLYYADRTENPEMTLKVTGFQWYWGYQYPDNENIEFTAYMIPDDEINADKGQLRVLSTDNPIVLPTDTNIAIQMTAGDVLHSWTVPALGVKIDAVPGRLNETWVRINKPGTYYGQCSEICGKNHAYMPIEVVAVPRDDFDAWVGRQVAGMSPAEATELVRAKLPVQNTAAVSE